MAKRKGLIRKIRFLGSRLSLLLHLDIPSHEMNKFWRSLDGLGGFHGIFWERVGGKQSDSFQLEGLTGGFFSLHVCRVRSHVKCGAGGWLVAELSARERRGQRRTSGAVVEAPGAILAGTWDGSGGFQILRFIFCLLLIWDFAPLGLLRFGVGSGDSSHGTVTGNVCSCSMLHQGSPGLCRTKRRKRRSLKPKKDAPAARIRTIRPGRWIGGRRRRNWKPWASRVKGRHRRLRHLNWWLQGKLRAERFEPTTGYG